MYRSLSPVKLISVSALILTLSACAAPKPTIRANADPNANLSAYRTYGFVSELGTNRNGYSTPMTTYFKEAVTQEMNTRGFRLVETNPELLVNFNANIQEKTDVRSTPTATAGVGYYGYRSGFYGTYPMYGNDVSTVHYKVGTANVDIVDSAKKQLIWEGVAEGKLTDKVIDDPRGAVAAVITQMFAKFPGAQRRSDDGLSAEG